MVRLRPTIRAACLGKSLFITSSIYNAAGSTFVLIVFCNSETTDYYMIFSRIPPRGGRRVMVEAKPYNLFIVPCALGQLASSSAGLDALKSCHSVNSFGAVCPTELGNRLVEEGVKLNSGYPM
jgi:hypothetical protein